MHVPVISVDDHLIEPPDLFEGRMPAALVPSAPRVVEDDDGAQAWLFEGSRYPNVGLNAVVGRPREEWSMEPARFDQMRPGCFDITARIDDMDRAGIWASLCFPSLVSGFCGAVYSRARDKELGLACLRAFNDWHLEEWVGPHPERIIVLQLPWLADVAMAADEVRANAARGFKAVSFPEFPAQLGLPSIFSGAWDPFLGACEETGTVVCLHTGASSWAALPSPDPPFELLPTFFPVNALLAAGEWLWSGVPLRFPDLSIALSEGGIGWVPMLMDRADYVLGHSASGTESRAWPSDMLPSEVLRRNFWFCSIDDPSAVAQRHVIGLDHIMVECDYPHADSTWPDTQLILMETWGAIPEDELRAVAGGNASRLFDHPLPAVDDWRPPASVTARHDLLAMTCSPTPLPPRAGPVVDADGHVVEPPGAWAGLPEWCRPEVAADAHGYEHVTVAGREILAVPLGTLARPGSSFDDPAAFRPLGEAQPGGADPVARLADMDVEGIDQAVLYPTIGLYFSAVEDPAAAVRLAAAYNDWLAGYCAGAPGRLFGAAMVPLQDPAAAARELRRAVTDLGFVGGFVRPNPCLGRSLSHPAYTVVWEAAEELGVPVGVHEGSSVIVPTLAADRPFNPLILHAVSHSFEGMLACAQLIAFGVLERHPGLRVVFLESSGGWAPFWLERLDEQAESFGGFCPDLRLRPSEYFARQCAISFEVGERTLQALVPFVGAERVVWGSDYPHHDATFPGAVEMLRDTVAPCPTAVQAKVLGLNARRIHGLPSRRTGPAGIVDDYFAAVTAHDTAMLGELFDTNAVLDVDGEVRRGRDAVLSYYTGHTFTYDDFRPAPGPLRVEGSRVHVAIDVHLGGADSVVHDVFETHGRHITSVRVNGFADSLRAATSR